MHISISAAKSDNFQLKLSAHVYLPNEVYHMARFKLTSIHYLQIMHLLPLNTGAIVIGHLSYKGLDQTHTNR